MRHFSSATRRTFQPPFTAVDAHLLERSVLFREFAAERAEVLKHKWIESEKAGRDIGFEKALMNWVIYHRAPWRQARRSAQP